MAQQEMSEEQIKELQEKIKNMSPEELREFQKKQCIFCQIISGKVQSKKIYEDDKSIAILDINPANPGHVLLLPKEHYAIMPQLSEEEIAHIFMVAKTISNACLRALKASGTNILVQNGVAAGQRAQHFMVHIIPRMDKDGVEFRLPQKEVAEDALENIRMKLEEYVGSGKKILQKKQAPAIAQILQKKAEGAGEKQVKDKGLDSQSTLHEPQGAVLQGGSGLSKIHVGASQNPKEPEAEVDSSQPGIKGEKIRQSRSGKKKQPGKKARAAKGGDKGQEETAPNLDDIARLLGG
ncbi:HIT domain-containing protein [Candidatus Woesearchaeota archaeon]|nr:HIT domain-containing protein [Candidatus Woesearchaeota archaeon]